MRRLLLLVLAAAAFGGGALVAALVLDDERLGAPERVVRRAVEGRRTPAARCPADLAGCRAVRGRVLLVEAVDPDGDGDLHVAVADGSLTAPGVTVIKVVRELRPAVDPRLGAVVSAAGTLVRGSRAEQELRAVVFRSAR